MTFAVRATYKGRDGWTSHLLTGNHNPYDPNDKPSVRTFPTRERAQRFADYWNAMGARIEVVDLEETR